MLQVSNVLADYKVVITYTSRFHRPQSPLDRSPFHQWMLQDGQVWASFHRIETGYLLRFPELADYEIMADGSDIVCHPCPGVIEEITRHLYLNQILPLALSIQGKLVFHSSAVEIGNAAVAFVADSGRGKSTLAASFASNGFSFLTDDGLVVEPFGTDFKVLPGHPSIRLRADSEKNIISSGTLRSPTLSSAAKSRFLAGPDISFSRRSLPLRLVYFLGDGSSEDVIISPLTGAESLVEWVKHSFLLDIEKRELLISHFDKVAKLAKKKIHYLLDYPRRYEKLASLRESIIEHINDEHG